MNSAGAILIVRPRINGTYVDGLALYGGEKPYRALSYINLI